MSLLEHLAPLSIWAAYIVALGLNLVTLHTQRLIWGRLGTALAAGAWATQLLWLIMRLTLASWQARHLQTSEVALLTGWLLVGLSLGLFLLWKETSLVLAPMVLGVALMWLGHLIPSAERPLPEGLKVPWLPIHVGSALLAYASFAAAAGASCLWILQMAALRSSAWLSWALRLPSLRSIEAFATACVVFGLVLIGLSMASGAVWALGYSGGLAGWLPKVAATGSVALGYVAYLMLGKLPRAAAYRPLAAIAGLAVVAASLLALPLLGPGLHDFLYR